MHTSMSIDPEATPVKKKAVLVAVTARLPEESLHRELTARRDEPFFRA